MYEDFFQLQKRPFIAAPCTDRYFPLAVNEAALVTLDRCVRRSEGIGLVIGTTGMGKTIMCRTLEKRLNDQFEMIYLQSARLDSPKALLQSILYRLQRPYRGLDENELRLELQHYLESGEIRGQALVLIVDDAQGLRCRLLDELRSILNLGEDGAALVRIVMAGTPLLEEHLGSPKLQSLNQRVVTRCYLEPLEREETFALIRHQTRRKGADAMKLPPLFTDEACAAIHRATGGLPRLINQLGDHALLFAFHAEIGEVDATIVERAWADLQQLPTPWTAGHASSASSGSMNSNTSAPVDSYSSPGNGLDSEATAQSSSNGSSSSSVIEFGSLDDDPCFDAPQPLRSLDEPSNDTVSGEADETARHEPLDNEPEMVEPEVLMTQQDETVESWSTENESLIRFNNPFEEVFDEEIVVSGQTVIEPTCEDMGLVCDKPGSTTDPVLEIEVECSGADMVDSLLDQAMDAEEPVSIVLQDQQGSMSDQMDMDHWYNETPTCVIGNYDDAEAVSELAMPGGSIQPPSPVVVEPLALQEADGRLNMAVDQKTVGKLTVADLNQHPTLSVVSANDQEESTRQTTPGIVIEDDYDEAHILPVTPFGVIRRQQFESLFTKLRNVS